MNEEEHNSQASNYSTDSWVWVSTRGTKGLMDRPVDRVGSSPKRLSSLITHSHHYHQLHFTSQLLLQQMRHSALLAHRMHMDPAHQRARARVPGSGECLASLACECENEDGWAVKWKAKERVKWWIASCKSQVLRRTRCTACWRTSCLCPSRRIHILYWTHTHRAMRDNWQSAMLIATAAFAFYADVEQRNSKSHSASGLRLRPEHCWHVMLLAASIWCRTYSYVWVYSYTDKYVYGY